MTARVGGIDCIEGSTINAIERTIWRERQRGYQGGIASSSRECAQLGVASGSGWVNSI